MRVVAPERASSQEPGSGKTRLDNLRLVESDAKRPWSGARAGGRAILFAGVAGACAMGAGLGYWARPALHERQAVSAAPEVVAPPPATVRKLQIVVGDRPAPAGAPIPVLPAGAASPAPTPLFEAPPQRTPSPVGLIRAEAVVPPAPEPRPAHPPIPRAVVPAGAGRLIARAEAPPVRHAAEPPLVRRAEASPPAAAKVAKVQLAKAEKAKAEAAKLQLAKVEARKAEAAKAKAAELQLAKAEAAKAEAARAKAAELQLAKVDAAKAHAAKLQAAKAAAHRLELAQAGNAKAAAEKAQRAEKAEQVRLAAAEAKGRAEAREDARQQALADAHVQARQEALADARKRARLTALAHMLARSLPNHGRIAPAPVEMAQAQPQPPDRHHHKAGRELKVEQASLKARHGQEPAHQAAVHPARPRPESIAPQPGNGLMMVSTTPRCTSRDPGEALVCADPGLSAADRQLSRAYQIARAAGVPDAQLRSQQQRWLAARSAAAREAPWAVRDVYMARIAELNGQAKDAQGGY